jgi:predicted DNA-binding protein YlxM (UPF0122 family)
LPSARVSLAGSVAHKRAVKLTHTTIRGTMANQNQATDADIKTDNLPAEKTKLSPTPDKYKSKHSRYSTSQEKENNRKINVTQALKYRFENHLTYEEIAEKFGVCRSAVQQRIAKVIDYLGNPEENQAYDHNKQYFMTGVERQLLKQLLDKNKAKKATMGNVAYALDKVNNILRLERGQATGNQNVQVQIIRFSDAKKQVAAQQTTESDGKVLGIKSQVVDIIKVDT